MRSAILKSRRHQSFFRHGPQPLGPRQPTTISRASVRRYTTRALDTGNRSAKGVWSACKGASRTDRCPAWPGIDSTDSSAARPPFTGLQRINIRWKVQGLRFARPERAGVAQRILGGHAKCLWCRRLACQACRPEARTTIDPIGLRFHLLLLLMRDLSESAIQLADDLLGDVVSRIGVDDRAIQGVRQIVGLGVGTGAPERP